MNSGGGLNSWKMMGDAYLCRQRPAFITYLLLKLGYNDEKKLECPKRMNSATVLEFIPIGGIHAYRAVQIFKASDCFCRCRSRACCRVPRAQSPSQSGKKKENPLFAKADDVCEASKDAVFCCADSQASKHPCQHQSSTVEGLQRSICCRCRRCTCREM